LTRLEKNNLKSGTEKRRAHLWWEEPETRTLLDASGEEFLPLLRVAALIAAVYLTYAIEEGAERISCAAVNVLLLHSGYKFVRYTSVEYFCN
jgi:hypothetical protein